MLPSRIGAGLLVWTLGSCKAPEPQRALAVEATFTPRVSACEPQSLLGLEWTVSPGFDGEQAVLSDLQGEPLANGMVQANRLHLDVPWTVALGPVRGTLAVAEHEVAVVVPTTVVPAAAPTIQAFGVEHGGDLVDPGDLLQAMADSPWGDALDVAAFSSLRGRFDNPHEDLGVSALASFERCSSQGCVALGTSEASPAQVELSSSAAETCQALPSRELSTYLFRVVSACGVDERMLTARFVQDDCDTDGRGVAEDCDDQDSRVSLPGTVVADGSVVPGLADASEATEVLLCVDPMNDTFIGGVRWLDAIRLEAVGGTAEILPQDGPTLRFDGEAEVRGLRVHPGSGLPQDDGWVGGNSIFALDALSLVLEQVDVWGGSAEAGGALVGPRNGNLRVEGGSWSGGVATQHGGVAVLHGGELRDLVVEDGVADVGGGLANFAGELHLTDSELRSNQAGRGGAVFTDSAARLSGCEVVDNRAAEGAGLAAELAMGEVLDLRPSVVDLAPTTFRDNEADGPGGALHVRGGRVAMVLVEAQANRALHGGMAFLDGVDWASSSTRAIGNVAAEDGAVLALAGGHAEVVQADWGDATAGRGALWVGDDATASLQASTISTSSGCAVWIDEGNVALSWTDGVNNDADLCGQDFSLPFGPASCSNEGCP